MTVRHMLELCAIEDIGGDTHQSFWPDAHLRNYLSHASIYEELERMERTTEKYGELFEKHDVEWYVIASDQQMQFFETQTNKFNAVIAEDADLRHTSQSRSRI